MKKKYETPKAEMLEFKYEETIVASGDNGEIEPTGNGKGKGNSINSCAKGNGAEINSGCDPREWK